MGTSLSFARVFDACKYAKSTRNPILFLIAKPAKSIRKSAKVQIHLIGRLLVGLLLLFLRLAGTFHQQVEILFRRLVPWQAQLGWRDTFLGTLQARLFQHVVDTGIDGIAPHV